MQLTFADDVSLKMELAAASRASPPIGDSIRLAVVALGSVDSVPVGELKGSCNGCSTYPTHSSAPNTCSHTDWRAEEQYTEQPHNQRWNQWQEYIACMCCCCCCCSQLSSLACWLACMLLHPCTNCRALLPSAHVLSHGASPLLLDHHRREPKEPQAPAICHAS
jgi:hypothetical protein